MYRKVAVFVVALSLISVAGFAQGVLFVKSNKVGIGTATPAFGLDVKSADGSQSRIQVENTGAAANRTMFKIINNGFPRFVMQDSGSGAQWLMTGGTTFIFGKVGSGVNEMVISSGGNVTIGGTLTQNSSRSVKTDFEAVDSRLILDRLAELPLQEWRYKHDSASDRHFGPFAEDFHQAFGLGSSPETISSLDTSGVTMAAVQSLYEIVKEKENAIESLRMRNEDLEERLLALETAIHQQ